MRKVLAAAVLSLVAAAAVAHAADKAHLRAVPGQAYAGFLVAPGDDHAFELDDFPARGFSLVLKAGRGSTLQPDIALEDPAAADATPALAPYRTDGAGSVKVRNAPFPSGPGRYVLRVRGKAGTLGTYTLKITSNVARSFRGEGLVPGSDTIPLSACAEAVVALKVRPILPGDLSPQFGAVTPPGCLAAAVAPHATKAGQGTLAVPAAGDYLVQVVGAGGTLGAFRWTAKVKPVKPSKAAVGVNAGAPAFPGPGPLPSKPVTGGGPAVAGFDADALGLGWREYRVQGNSKNSANLLVFRGNDASRLGNNFADDGTPDPRTVALGPTHLLVEANGELWAFPRDGSPGARLFDPGVDTARVLCDGAAAYVLTPLGVLTIPLAGGTPQPTLLPPSGILDMAFGGRGLVYVLDQGALLEVHTSRTDGTDDVILSPVDPDPGLKALAARGGDVFLATDEGPTDSRILRVPACGGSPVEIHRGAPVSALAADELNVYGIEADPVNGTWVRQFPRGGGVSQVLVRSDGTAFVIDPSDVATAGGWVYFLASSGGDPEFRRVKRR